MKIAIIGTGSVGSVLGQRWAQAGHEIIYGSRHADSDHAKELVRLSGPLALVTTCREAVMAAEIIVLAVAYRNVKAVLAGLGPLDDKIFIDCTNPLRADLSGLDLEAGTSAAEEIAQWVKPAWVVKAFNSIGTRVMADPVFADGKAALFIAGDDQASKNIVSQLSQELDFDVVDCGRLEIARLLESMAMLWIHLAFKQKMGTDFGLKLLKPR